MQNQTAQSVPPDGTRTHQWIGPGAVVVNGKWVTYTPAQSVPPDGTRTHQWIGPGAVVVNGKWVTSPETK